MKRKDWAEICSRINCCYDLLEILKENRHLDLEFLSKVSSVQKHIGLLSDEAFVNSLNKKERKEFGVRS